MDLFKEVFRLALLAVVSWLATEGVLVKVFTQVGLDPVLKMQVIGVVVVLLKGVDRWLHETGTATKGLVRF